MEQKKLTDGRINNIISRYALLGKSPEWIKKYFVDKRLLRTEEAASYVDTWFSDAEKLTPTAIKDYLCKFLLQKVGECDSVNDEEGVQTNTSLLIKTLGMDPEKNSKALAKMQQEQTSKDTTSVSFKLKL